MTEPPPNYAQPAYAPPNNDAEHLRLLSIFHYVCAGITALFSSFFIMHVVMGIAMMQGENLFDQLPKAEGQPPFPDIDTRGMGLMFAAAGSFAVLSGWAFAVCLAIAGRKLAARRSRTFCLVIAAISCTFVPVGTALGVFTIIVLSRPSVQALFDQPPTVRSD
jgi:hypothetical protein